MRKRKNMGWVFGVASIFLLLGTPLSGGAEPNNILSKVHPYITVQEEYNNNILLTNKNKIDDFITTVNAGLKFSALSEKTYGIDLGFAAGFVYYAEHHKFNYFSPSGTLNAWYTMTPKLTFRVRDYLIRSDEAREQVYTANALPNQYLLSTERGKHAVYIRNVVEPSMEYQFGKENLISVLYRNNIYRNQSSQFEDSQENSISPKLTYWFDIRNGVVFGYVLTLGNFQRSPDLVGHGATAQYVYRLNPRLSFFGDYGYLKRDFKSPGVDYDVHNPSIGIQYQFSPTLTGSAQGGYFWQIPDRGSKTGGLSYNLALTKSEKRTTYTLSFQGGYTEDYFTAQNLGFNKYYRTYGTISHQLTEKMTVGITGSLERSILSSDEKDWIWGISGNASYQLLKWLALSLQVSHIENHSNIYILDEHILNYSQYRGIFRVTATF